MASRLLSFACALALVLSHPVHATPRSDAESIAAHFVQDDGFTTLMRDMLAKSAAEKLAWHLGQRSIKVRDDERFLAALPDYFQRDMAERVERRLADELEAGTDTDALSLLAEQIRTGWPDEGVEAPNAGALTLEDQLDGYVATVESAETKAALVAIAVGAIMIGLMVQEVAQLEVDLTAPYLPDILATKGIFEFPNRIVQQDLIRELQAAGP